MGGTFFCINISDKYPILYTFEQIQKSKYKQWIKRP